MLKEVNSEEFKELAGKGLVLADFFSTTCGPCKMLGFVLKDVEKEFGDVMFSLINAARLYKINPENALEKTNRKFIRRFNYLEAHTLKQGRQLTDMSLAEMDEIWNEAKKAERAEDAGNQ